jgi:hypothetical protein
MPDELATFLTTGQGGDGVVVHETGDPMQPEVNGNTPASPDAEVVNDLGDFWGKPEPVEPEVEIETPETPATGGIPQDLQDYLAAGNTDIDEFYRQKYAQQQVVGQPTPTQQAPETSLDPLSKLDGRVQELSGLLEKNYELERTGNLTADQWKDLYKDRVNMQNELSKLSVERTTLETKQRADFAGQMLGTYRSQFTERIQKDLGIARVGPEITKALDDFLTPIIEKGGDLRFLSDPMVQEMVVKAKLYDSLVAARNPAKRGERAQIPNAGGAGRGTGRAATPSAGLDYESMSVQDQLNFLRTGGKKQ